MSSTVSFVSARRCARAFRNSSLVSCASQKPGSHIAFAWRPCGAHPQHTHTTCRVTRDHERTAPSSHLLHLLVETAAAGLCRLLAVERARSLRARGSSAATCAHGQSIRDRHVHLCGCSKLLDPFGHAQRAPPAIKVSIPSETCALAAPSAERAHGARQWLSARATCAHAPQQRRGW